MRFSSHQVADRGTLLPGCCSRSPSSPTSCSPSPSPAPSSSAPSSGTPSPPLHLLALHSPSSSSLTPSCPPSTPLEHSACPLPAQNKVTMQVFCVKQQPELSAASTLHPEHKVHRSKLALRKSLLARGIVREARPPSCCFKSLLHPPHLFFFSCQLTPDAVEFIVPRPGDVRLPCDVMEILKKKSTPSCSCSAGLGSELCLLSGVSYIVHVVLLLSPPVSVTLANVLGNEKGAQEEWINSGCVFTGGKVQKMLPCKNDMWGVFIRSWRR